MNPTLVFLLVAGALVAIALSFILPALWRPRRGAGVSRARLNAAIYRQQSAEVRRDSNAGLLAADDAQRVHDELLQRMLADVTPDRPERPAQGRRTAVVVTVAVPALAALLYLVFGNPRELGRPPTLADRGSASGPRADELEQHVRDHPADGRAWVMLARARSERDDVSGAAQAYARAIEASVKVARDPAVLCEYADVLAMTQGGSLAGRPAELVNLALAIDQRQPVALEMAGSAAFERRDYARAAAYWATLLEQLAPGSRRHGELSAAIERARRMAGSSS